MYVESRVPLLFVLSAALWHIQSVSIPAHQLWANVLLGAKKGVKCRSADTQDFGGAKLVTTYHVDHFTNVFFLHVMQCHRTGALTRGGRFLLPAQFGRQVCNV